MILERIFTERKSEPYGGQLGQLISSWLRDGGDASPLNDVQAMRLTTVSACVRLNASVLASLPLHMFQWRSDGGKDRVVNNSLTKLLARPNAWQTGMQFRELLQGWTLLHGNGYAWINWSKAPFTDPSGVQSLQDRAIELLPIHPCQMRMTQSGGWRQEPVYQLLDGQGRWNDIPSEEVFHLRGPSLDGMTGWGVIEGARQMLQGALETQRYTRQFWENDATPGVVLTYEQPLTATRAKEERERWDDAHAKDARRTAVLSGGVKIDRLSLSAEDSQFLQTREYQAYEIAGLFLTPPHMIGLLTKSTSWGSGIEEQHIGWVTTRLRPDARRWEEAIAQKLIVLDQSYFVEHVWNGLLAGDSQRRSAFYASAVQNGWMTRNEVRTRENLNPLPGLDEPLAPLNMQPASESGDTQDEVAPESDPSEPDEDDAEMVTEDQL